MKISYLTKKNYNFICDLILKKIKSNFLSKKKINILNYGCADGTFDKYLADFLDHNSISFSLTSSDIIENGIDDKIINHLKKYDWTFKKTDPNKINQSNIDLIVSTDVFEHIPTPYSFLGDCLNSLNDNGFIIFLTPNLFRFMNIFRLIFNRLNFPKDMGKSNFKNVGEEVHIKEYAKWDLKIILDEIGYKNVETYCYYYGLYSFNFDELLKFNSSKNNFGQNLIFFAQKN